MFRNKFRHFEHRNLVFSEDWFQFIVSVDRTTVFLILKIVLLDVGPNFLHHFNHFTFTYNYQLQTLFLISKRTKIILTGQPNSISRAEPQNQPIRRQNASHDLRQSLRERQ